MTSYEKKISHLHYYFVNSMGRPKHIRVMAGALEGDMFVGQRADDHRGLLSIKYPMEHGIITDWNDMERIWTHIYGKVDILTGSCSFFCV